MNDPAIRLNLGCGRRPLDGWVNLDLRSGHGVDVVADLNTCRSSPLPFADNSVSEFLLSHVIEHIGDTLGLMQELHRIALPDATATIAVPFGGSDDAWTDPTHLRPYFIGSFAYFAQPLYWRADYGYRGDWQAERVHLLLEPDCAGLSPRESLQRARRERNVVREMTAVLRAIKPVRRPDDQMQAPVITLEIAA